MLKGFSLIELMIVLAITGILAAISYPGYREYIVRAHRSDGQSALLDLACRMETYYAEHNTYKTATIGTGKPTDVLNQPYSPERWYILSLTHVTDTTYTLQATPVQIQDPRCQSLTLTSSGIKGITAGTQAGITQCW
jgi:type IV pilus assembly protein PilE